MPDSTYRKLTT